MYMRCLHTWDRHTTGVCMKLQLTCNYWVTYHVVRRTMEESRERKGSMWRETSLLEQSLQRETGIFVFVTLSPDLFTSQDVLDLVCVWICLCVCMLGCCDCRCVGEHICVLACMCGEVCIQMRHPHWTPESSFLWQSVAQIIQYRRKKTCPKPTHCLMSRFYLFQWLKYYIYWTHKYT